MLKFYLVLLLSLFSAAVCGAATRGLDDIRRTLEESSSRQLQEKVYVHTDNTCYFVGDTLWFKAYVVRAGDLRYTDMSRILYVELLTPDGLLVERQNIIVSDKGYGCGAFCLRDSLYSGYYELRAYTRWMLSFNVSERRYSKNDSYYFYNANMARDYFRQWDGLYSRVLPVYAKPDSAGDFTYKRMLQRPKQRLRKQLKPELKAAFFPEGGHLVDGVENRVAFELTDQNGAAVDVRGVVTRGGATVAEVQTSYMGRGTFTVTPNGGKRMEAVFNWQGKDYDFKLPEAEEAGVALSLAGNKLTVTPRNLPAGHSHALSVLCRGVLRHFSEIDLSSGLAVTVDMPPLPTGVNDVTVFDDDGRILADRLFFVNNNDCGGGVMTVESGDKKDYAPYERIDLSMRCDGVTEPTQFSVAVRDTRTDEPSYDDGNMLTDLLLGSELRGFVARPAYYFESGDKAHADALDLLMMVQGWRKYNWQELADTTYFNRRYKPESTMTIEGGVYKMLSVNEVEREEIPKWRLGQGLSGRGSDDEENGTSLIDQANATEETETSTSNDVSLATENESGTAVGGTIAYDNIGNANVMLGVNHGGLKKEVLVEAEISVGRDYAGSVQKTTDGGRFVFEIPPFYGVGVLNMKAYNVGDSLAKNMASRKDKYALNEDAYPDYYVKRDLFYPVSATKYSYYQNHAPEMVVSTDDDSLSELSMENDVHQLKNVNVKGSRRGKRAINFTKPAFVVDAYEMYNNMTDYGLSFGKPDMRQFPVQVGRFLYGNMGRYNRFNVDGRIAGNTYYRNYVPDTNNASKVWDNRNAQALYNTLKLKRLESIRVFTDYEPRNEDSVMVVDHYNADVTVELVPFPDDAMQPSMRDRHCIIYGFSEPMDFYSPDYSSRQPAAPTDYRRTLYWNPNAMTDGEGRFSVSFFNNSKDTRIKVSAAGLAPDGTIVHN